MKTAEMVSSLLRDTVTGLGFDLYDVEYQKEDGNWVLTLFIDKPEGVTIDDCERVSRAVEPVLDEKDPIEQSYYLSVSSVGLDRPIKKDKDFERVMGEMLTVRLYAPLEGKKEYTGVLKGYDAESFTLEAEGKELTLRRKDAAKLVLYIEF